MDVNQLKLINLRIHIGKKQYYYPGENDPLLSPTASSNLYNSDVSSPTLA